MAFPTYVARSQEWLALAKESNERRVELEREIFTLHDALADQEVVNERLRDEVELLKCERDELRDVIAPPPAIEPRTRRTTQQILDVIKNNTRSDEPPTIEYETANAPGPTFRVRQR